jgi:hypothetical protein
VRLRRLQREIDAERHRLSAEVAKTAQRVESARKNMAALGSGGARGDVVRKAAKRLAALEKALEGLDGEAEALDDRERELSLERVELFKLFASED